MELKSNYEYFDTFLKCIEQGYQAISTGFEKLDSLLNGGLYSQLYVLGAMSSVGKTSLTLQIADNIANSGTGVIMFSIEMTKNNMMSKTLSRLSYEANHRLSCIDIMKLQNIETTKELLNLYQNTSKNIFLYEGITTLELVSKTIEEYISTYNAKPVVIIDYLQIMATDKSLSDKQKIDFFITNLHYFCKRYDIPIIAISSFSRVAYEREASMSSFKESGNIEYEADVLLSLEKENQNNDIVKLSVIKQRNGQKDVSSKYHFVPKYSYFEEV